MERHPRSFVAVLARLVAGCLCGTAAVALAQDVAKEKPIELPTYTVTDSRALPPPESWHYARIPGFEVLSNASERATKELVKDFQWFNQSLSLIWPAARLPTVTPISLIICGRGGKFDAFLPEAQRGQERSFVGIVLRAGEQSAIVVDAAAKSLGLRELPGWATVEGLVPETTATTGGNGERGLEETAVRQLYRDYIRFLLAGTEPRAPLWFEEGLAQILMGIEVTRTTITVGKVTNPNVSDADPDTGAAGLPSGTRSRISETNFNAFFRSGQIPPTDQLFAVRRESSEEGSPANLVWVKHCQAFVHWGLYGKEGKNQKAFITFLTRLDREPLTEALFQDCFKLTYEQMREALRSYVELTLFKIAGVRTGKGETLPVPAPVELREATEAESGRINGDALRVAGNLPAARTALATPYIRGDRDPQLLAALGLLERAAGDEVRARKILEAAAKGKAVRPRAYLELARLYLADASAKPAGADGRFSAEQTATVLTPLFTALVQLPPLSEVYELVADTWTRSIVAPAPQNIAVLDEGVRRLPRNTALIYATAVQKVRLGLVSEATALIALGLKSGPEGSTLRSKLEALRASLPAVTVPSPAVGSPK